MGVSFIFLKPEATAFRALALGVAASLASGLPMTPTAQAQDSGYTGSSISTTPYGTLNNVADPANAQQTAARKAAENAYEKAKAEAEAAQARLNTAQAAQTSALAKSASDPTAVALAKAQYDTAKGAYEAAAARYNSATATLNQTKKAESETRQGNITTYKENLSNVNLDTSGRCGASSQIMGGNPCRGTDSIVEAGKLTNTAGQISGSITTQIQGQQANYNAVNQGTQSAVMDGAAKTAETAGQMQLAVGGANMAMGIAQLLNSRARKKDAAQMEEAAAQVNRLRLTQEHTDEVSGITKDSTKDVAHGSIDQKSMSEFNGAAHNAVEASGALKAGDLAAKDIGKVRGTLQAALRKGAGEQQDLAGQASAGAFASMVAGAQQLAQGYFNLKSADEMSKAAKDLKNIENGQNKVVAAPGADPFPTVTNAPGTDQNLLGTGVTASPAPVAAESQPDNPDYGDLGSPTNTAFPGGGVANAPIPGGFKAGDTPTGGGAPGGGGAALSTSPAGAGESGGGAEYADNRGSPTYAAGGGGGGGAGAGSKGPDLSNLLSQFLPKKDDPNPMSILEFGKDGNRGPASEGEDSILGRDTDIFKRVHDQYQVQAKNGRVGG